MEALSLIDVSGEDDFLLDLASPPQQPDPPPRAAPGTSAVGADLEHPAGGSPVAAAAGKVLDPSGAMEQVPERTQSPKKRKPKGGVNLRKSLAWDSAFFTGEGVLDTEELGIVNSTFRKTQGSRLLPGIVEEMRRSNESTTSTLESESFVLESLETELFDNVRASIQRTLGKPDKAPGVTAASSKNPKATAKAPPVTARKGVDRIPQTQSKIRPPVSTSNGGVGSKQRAQVTPKEPSVARVTVSRATEAKPSSRPPRALPRVATMGAPANTAATSGISDKRSSTGGVANRQAVGKSANTSASMPSRPSGGSKTSSTSKSGALPSAAIASSHGAPMGTMAGAKTKSPTLIGKGRAQRIPLRSSSRSDISKVDPARASRSKIPTRSHGEVASPIISPSSSVDSMSSVISGASTASTIGRASHTSESFSTRSSSLSPSTRKSNDHPPTSKPRPLTVTQGTPCDNLKFSTDTSTQGNGFKPSGLRRPTPKIGYFDAEKSVEQKAARAQLQSTKILFSPLATPNPRISYTPKATFEFSTIDQEELKSMAAAVSQTKASPSLPLRVAQTEVKPSKVAEHEASQIKASTSVPLRVAEIEVESSKMTEPEASHAEPLPSLPLRVAQTEVDSSKALEHEASQTEASPLLSLGVAQTEVEPSKVREHEASQTKESPPLLLRVAKTEVEPSKVTEREASQTEDEPSRGTEQAASQTEASPLLHHGVAQTEVESSKVMEHEPSQTKASNSLLLRVAETEVDSSKMSEHEAHMLETGPLVAMDIAEESTPALHQNIQANDDDSPSTVKLSSCTIDLQESETMAAPGEESSPSQINVAQTEVEPSKVMEHEGSQTKASPSLPFRVAQTELEQSKVIEHEASQIEVSPSLPLRVAQTVKPSQEMEYEGTQPEASPSPPLRVAQTEVEPSKVTEHEASQTEASPLLLLRVAQTDVEPSKVSEHEAHMLETRPLVALDISQESIPALHQNIETNGDGSPSAVKLSFTIDQQESETAAALGEESIPSQANVAQMEVEPSEVIEHEASQTKASLSLPLGVAKMEVEPSEVIDHEAWVPQACSVSAAMDNAKENIQPRSAPSPLKENILASHQNIKAKVATTPAKGNISSSHLNMQAIGDMTPVTLLSQKLSSISLGPANGEATPLTLLAQKLSSISLGDATD